jgi:hypothetical protein
MKVKDLLKEIKRQQKVRGKDFLEWDVYTEQCTEEDKQYKRTEQKWEIIDCSDCYDDWEYFYCAGFNTIMPKEKIFTINVNY